MKIKDNDLYKDIDAIPDPSISDIREITDSDDNKDDCCIEAINFSEAFDIVTLSSPECRERTISLHTKIPLNVVDNIVSGLLEQYPAHMIVGGHQLRRVLKATEIHTCFQISFHIQNAPPLEPMKFKGNMYAISSPDGSHAGLRMFNTFSLAYNFMLLHTREHNLILHTLDPAGREIDRTYYDAMGDPVVLDAVAFAESTTLPDVPPSSRAKKRAMGPLTAPR